MKTEEEDEFFGNQDEEIKDCVQPDVNATSSGVSSDVFTDGLARHEARAVENRYRNIGYHESYDTYKETRLQEGFEVGYKQMFDSAMRIGQMLGEVATPVAFASSKLSKNSTSDEDDAESETHLAQRQKTAETVAAVIRKFIDTFQRRQQGDDETSDDESRNGSTADIHEVERTLKELILHHDEKT